MSDIKILLVDDEQDFISALSERLEIRDLKSNTALDGAQAMNLVSDQEPDIMILDLKMPGINGMEVLRRVKKSYPRVQVIIHTGHVNDLDEAEARELGVFDYLKKPVDIELLVDRIRAAAKATRIEDSMAAAAYAEAGEPDTARKMMKG
jgi:DNA-binding response OmpR family regulator